MLHSAIGNGSPQARPAHSGARATPPPELLFTLLTMRGANGGQGLAALVERISGSIAAGTEQPASIKHGRAFIRI